MSKNCVHSIWDGRWLRANFSYCESSCDEGISPAAEGESQLVDRLHKLARVALIILVRVFWIEKKLQFFFLKKGILKKHQIKMGYLWLVEWVIRQRRVVQLIGELDTVRGWREGFAILRRAARGLPLVTRPSHFLRGNHFNIINQVSSYFTLDTTIVSSSSSPVGRQYVRISTRRCATEQNRSCPFEMAICTAHCAFTLHRTV